MQAKRLKRAAAGSAPVFAALGDETRLRLVGRLSSDGPASITCLAAGSKVSRQAITKHLHVLAKAGLVKGFRHGRERLYEFDPQPLDQAHRYLEIISQEWEQALNRLKLFVEGS